jgi:hypothetical protein
MYFLLKSRKQWGENPGEGYIPGSKSVKAESDPLAEGPAGPPERDAGNRRMNAL